MPHAARQQVVRVDREPEPLNEVHPALLDMITSARNFAKASDALLISDYGYGAATPRLLTFIRSDGSLGEMPVTLDSRYRLLEYSGVTAATPNEPEVEAALDVKIGMDGDVMGAGERLREKMKLQSLVITRGSDGMVVFEEGGDPVEVPIHGSDQVTDVTGAGDTVIATFTAALATGADPVTAARLANYAGGIVVMKRGTATVSRDELLHAIESEAAVKTR
jgi:D-glycero-beta-D-manno-heptose-7-phosphate kinase